jgi:hypothetical protein
VLRLYASRPVTAGSRQWQICDVQNGRTLDRFVSQQFNFPLKAAVHHRPALIFINMLLLPEGQRDEIWKPSKNHRIFVNLGALGRDIQKVRRQYLYTSGGGKFPSFCERNHRKYNEWYRIWKKLCNRGKGMHKWRKLKEDECRNVRMGDEYWFANFVNSLELWKASRSF